MGLISNNVGSIADRAAQCHYTAKIIGCADVHYRNSTPSTAICTLRIYFALIIAPTAHLPSAITLEFHGTNTDTDTDILADFRASILARMSVRDARMYTCKRVLYTISYRVHVYKITSVSVSVLWNLSISHDVCSQHGVTALSRLVTASRDKLDRPKLKRVSPSRR